MTLNFQRLSVKAIMLLYSTLEEIINKPWQLPPCHIAGCRQSGVHALPAPDCDVVPVNHDHMLTNQTIGDNCEGFICYSQQTQKLD